MLTRKTTLLIKAESTAGTYQSDIAAGDGILAYDVVATPEIAMFKRDPQRQYLSRDKSLAGMRPIAVTFKVELRGSGTAGTAPSWGAALIACGFDETVSAATSVTYTPTSGNGLESPFSIAVYEDGMEKQIAGAMGNVRLVGTVGEPLFLEFTFRGKLNAISAAGIVTPTVDATVPEVLLNASFATDLASSESHVVSAIEMDMQNEVTLRPSVNDSKGISFGHIVARNPIGSMDPEYNVTYDFLDDITSDTTGTMTLTLGATAGNIATITAPALRFLAMDPLDREGTRALTVPFELNASSGNDELSIALT